MEFKGTKGKWKYTNHISKDFTHEVNRVDSEIGVAICVIRTNNQSQAEANALLISKAPEMLEILHKAILVFSNDEVRCGYSDLIEEMKLLISQVTELK